MPTKIDNLAYNEGRKAYFRAASLKDNPYPANSDNPFEEIKEYSWEYGYNSAYREEEIEYDFNAD